MKTIRALFVVGILIFVLIGVAQSQTVDENDKVPDKEKTPPPSPKRLIDTPAGTIIDVEMGLEWAPASKSTTLYNATYEEAETQVDLLKSNGQEGWRLPKRHELESLISLFKNEPALASRLNMTMPYYWIHSPSPKKKNYISMKSMRIYSRDVTGYATPNHGFILTRTVESPDGQEEKP